MQRLMQFVTIILLGVIVTALVNSRGLSQIGIPTRPLFPPAQRQPFQTSFAVSVSGTSGFVAFTAPSHGLLVIQTLSMYRISPVSGTVVQCFFAGIFGGNQTFVALPIVGDGPSLAFSGATLAATLYVDPGTQVGFDCYRSANGSEVDDITVSGYVGEIGR
jgi:hypothetical protein